MKLSDINQELTEKPVGMLKRGLTKLKKHTPFNADARAEAEGQDEVEAAANAVNTAFRKWVGKNNKVTLNVIPHEELIKFFELVNMGKTANEVISRIPEVKKLSQGSSKIDISQKGTDYTNQANQAINKNKQQQNPNEVNYGTFSVNSKGAMESLEGRLAKMLNEVEVDQTDSGNPVVFFNQKDAEKIILDVVSEIESDNPDGLDDWLRAKGVRQEQPTADQAEPASGEADNIEQLEAMWDQMVGSLELSDKEAKVMKAAFDNARKIAAKS